MTRRLLMFFQCCLTASSFGVLSMTTTPNSGVGTTIQPPPPARNVIHNRNVPGLKQGMDYIRLGNSPLVVSKVCMGTMTFGEQNTIQEGVDQLHRAFDHYGVNFIDTAEMYPVPTKPTTQGKTDQAVRQFIQEYTSKHPRENIILATKVSGRSDRITWLRKQKVPTTVSKEQILESVDSSLQRLGTPYIDLLQIHWPDRYVGSMFGQPDFNPQQMIQSISSQTIPVSFEEQLDALQQVIRQGKVRYVGVSNETPYGVCTMVELAKRYPDLYPRIISIQNSYSLVVRKDFEAGLGEVCYHHNVGLLAYSPLAGGVLTGKYSDSTNLPKNARLRLFPGFMDRYLGSQNEAAVNEYIAIAKQVRLLFFIFSVLISFFFNLSLYILSSLFTSELYSFRLELHLHN